MTTTIARPLSPRRLLEAIECAGASAKSPVGDA